jgi:starch-binding outer membrane protein, SusD/RagB family
LRLADVILDKAYAHAMTGEDGLAKAELLKVRRRAFDPADQPTLADGYVAALGGGQALADAIMEERKLELAGEGKARWDMVISGKFPERTLAIRKAQQDMVNGLKANGFFTFSNGVTISNYIWTKLDNIKSIDASLTLLTGQTPRGLAKTDPKYPFLVPGWRGNSDTYASYIATLPSNKVNMAIMGLYEYIDPAGAEAAALEAAGYKKTNWGIDIVNNEDNLTAKIIFGYSDAFIAAGYPPRYPRAVPSETILKSNGLITQAYGHQSPAASTN